MGFYSSNPVYITNTFWCVWTVWPAGKVSGRGWWQLGWARWLPGQTEFVLVLCLNEPLLIALFCLCLGGWMAWSLWSACDDSGLQMRSRVCGAQGSTPCVGNSSQRRDCNEIPGESGSAQDAHTRLSSTVQRFLECVVLLLGDGLFPSISCRPQY